MRPLHSCFLAGLLAIVALFVLPNNGRASTVLQLDLESLVANSKHIVIGQVQDVEMRKEDDGRVYSYITLEVDEVLKGEPKQQIIIRQIGGRDGDLATLVHGMPTFEAQEEVLLFLDKPDPDRLPVVTGLAQGKFRIVLGPDDATRFAVPQVEDLNLVRRAPVPHTLGDAGSPAPQGALQQAPPSDLFSTIKELDTFKTSIRDIVREQSGETR